MDAARDYHTKCSESEGERPTLYGITYTWNLKHDTNQPIYETETDTQTQNRLVSPKVGGGREVNWEFGVGRCRLLHLECINNKVLLYSAKNYTQFPGIKDNGKGYIYIF